MSERDLEVALSYLDRLLRDELRDDWMATIALIACRQNVRDYPYVVRSTPVVNGRPHEYGPNRTPVAPSGQRRRVFQAMEQNGAFSAPAWSHKPITTGTVSILWPLNDMVVRLVDSARLLIYNVTLPKHILFPGFVKLAVEEAGNSTVVAVSGKGAGNWAYANENGGPVLFRTLLEGLAYHLRHYRY